MNLNDLARRVTLREGKKKSVSIAQVKEIIGLTLEELADENIFSVWVTLRRKKRKTNW